MSKTYDPHVHTHATMRGVTDDCGPVPIVLHTGARVWVAGSYSIETPETVRVGDGVGKCYDEDGNCILSLPAGLCSYYTDEEAAMIANVMAADHDLLSWAR